MNRVPRLLLVINEDRFFFSHRRDVAMAALRAGMDVTLVSRDTGRRGEVEALGIRFVDLPINPVGRNVSEELRSFRFLVRLYRRMKPDIVHHVGLKNILWGSLAARLVRVRGVVNAVSGLGTMFGDNTGPALRRMVMTALRIGMRHPAAAVIFQNHEDEQLFISHGLTKRSQTVFIKGSGVNLDEFAYTPPPAGEKTIVIFTARMLREKGVLDLADAAALMRHEYGEKVEFWLCGGISCNPGALSSDELHRICDGIYIKWLGHCQDVASLLRQASVMVLPSYYREGMPKSLIEASAIGRPIVTCDSVGCRDAVEEGVNGFKVEPRNPLQLADRISRLVDNPELRERMGRESRRIAERDYDIRDVVDKHMATYHMILSSFGGSLSVSPDTVACRVSLPEETVRKKQPLA